MKINYKNLIKEIKKQLIYDEEEADNIRVAISKVMDRTLLKPTLDTNTFADPDDDIDYDNYKWFRDNPNEYIKAFSKDFDSIEDPDLPNEKEQTQFERTSKKYGAIRDPKETTLLYYLYRGTYQDENGKWIIGRGENIDLVIREVNDRANQFVDAIGDFQQTIDFFFADYNKVKKWTQDYIDFKSQPDSLVSQFMSKGAPGGFKRLEFGKFTRDTAYQATNTQGLGGTRDHMYKGSREFDNIPDEHKPYFLFDYIWLACYNKAQQDGLQPSEKIVPILNVQKFNLNYQNGLTNQEDEDLFGGGWLDELSSKNPQTKETISSMSSGLLVASLVNPYLTVAPPNNHLMNDEEYNNYKGRNVSLSQMNDAEIEAFFSPHMDRLLGMTKEALKMNLYPSSMIQLLKFSDKIPEVLINKFKRKYNRTIKGMTMAGYLDESGNFTDKVKNKDIKGQVTTFNHLKNFESVVRDVSGQIETGIVDKSVIDRMYEKFEMLKDNEKTQALKILQKHGVNTDTISQTTITRTKAIDRVEQLLHSMLIDQEANKNNSLKYQQIMNLLSTSTEKGKEDIIKVINYYKKRGVT